MELIDNIKKTLKSDLITELRNGSKVSIAASCFSIYAFEELKKQLKDIDELRFIFTSPTFVDLDSVSISVDTVIFFIITRYFDSVPFGGVLRVVVNF